MIRLEEIAHFCGDVDAAVGFYEVVLGQKPQMHQPGEAAAFMLGDVQLFLHKKSEHHEPGWPLPDEDHTAFAVDDVDHACAELLARGLTIEVSPRMFYWGRSAYLRDPDGRLIELHER
jgi:catechol 2,3-dioxygenase-like lactoylglutathione lyase family enzyme